MTAETLILMVGIGIATRAMGNYLVAREHAAQYRNLRAFEKTYNEDFVVLELERGELVRDFRQEIMKGKADDSLILSRLQQKGKSLEQRLNALMQRVKSEGKVDLVTLRTEMQRSGLPQLELSQELLSKSLDLPVDVALRFEGVEGHYSYRFGSTGQIESRLRSIAAVVEKSSDSATGLRTLHLTFPDQRPVVFVERSDTFPVRAQHQVDSTHAGFQRLLTDFDIRESRLQQYVTWLVQREMKASQGQMSSAVQRVQRYLITLRNKANNEGRTFTDELTAVSKHGILGTQHRQEAQLADHLVAEGIRQDKMWLDARTKQEFNGAVAEMLALEVVQNQVRNTDHLVFRGVRLRGNMYLDRGLKQLHRKGTDVVPEIDLLAVSQQSGRFILHQIGNVKAYTSGSASDATSQNSQALALLRAHIAGLSQQVTSRGGNTYWVRITDNKGIDSRTGAIVELTGRLTEQAGGSQTQTIGPRGGRGFDQTLGVDQNQIKIIASILREHSAAEALGFGP